MNIFVTNPDPVLSAQYLDDKRVNKMCAESLQMLCTAIATKGIETPVKPTHRNHPANAWCRATRENYLWLCDHFEALLNEKYSRYGKEHSYKQHLNFVRKHANLFPSFCLTPFVNCAANKELGISFHHVSNVFDAYQSYLNERWKKDKQSPTRYKQPIYIK